MKKLIFFGVLGLFILASCNSTVTHTHNEHDHEAEGHNHATEDHDHSAHGDESGEGHSHETADSHLETAEARWHGRNPCHAESLGRRNSSLPVSPAGVVNVR